MWWACIKTVRGVWGRPAGMSPEKHRMQFEEAMRKSMWYITRTHSDDDQEKKQIQVRNLMNPENGKYVGIFIVSHYQQNEGYRTISRVTVLSDGILTMI